MASYNELNALIDAYINRNGVQAITGQILNGVLKAMVDQVGRGYAIMGVATPSTNPGTPDAPESWFASTPGTYTNFGGLEVADAEFALLSYTPSGEVWTKTTLTDGISEVSASIDGNVGTPEVTAEYINGGLIFTFSNMKGQTGDAAGFGTVNATVDGNIGTPGVSVNTSGPDTAKNITFAFRNLKGETGVTSVVATVDNTTGTPSCSVSLVGQELHLDFHGLKGAQGDTGSSVDYPFTIVNNLTTDDPTQALSAAQGVVLEGKVTQLEAKVDDLTNFQETGTHTLQMYFGLIGAADGALYPGVGDGKYLYSEDYAATPGDVFQLSNPNAKSLSWYRAFFYNGSTFVSYADLGTTVSNYTIPSGSFNKVRFCFSRDTGTFDLTDIVITSPTTVILVPVKDVVENNTQRIEALENSTESEQIDAINKGYRLAKSTDFTESKNGAFTISGGKLYGNRLSAEPKLAMVFNSGIKAIEFDIASLWDSNLISLCFGVGVDTGNGNKDCYAVCYLPTSQRPTEIGYITNIDLDGAASQDQMSSIYGKGRFSGDYRQPQRVPAIVSVGDHCRIDLIDGHFFLGRILNSTTKCWDWWFCLDTDGDWTIPSRFGWSTKVAIGFATQYGAISNQEIVSNLKIFSEADKASFIDTELARCLPIRKQWVAIGDSITQINNNNGLSYVGYAERELGYKVNNQGKSGWTIYKLWRDRVTAGWEDAVSALNDGDIVTILAGTNDFDTASFSTPADDTAMDVAANPHPRFGTTDPTSEDAKDPHTTLGCLRLMIERILTLKPGARLSVFSPFYREKGLPVGTTSWNKLYINSDGHTIYDYADAIYSVAREYNLHAYNTCRDCGINAMTLATYTYDDLHIGQVGGELIGDYVAKRIS